MNKCIFLDRDGVINKERGEYTYKINDFECVDGVINELKLLKKKGYLLIVITNQGGINKGIYTSKDVLACHQYFQKLSNNVIDDFFYSPYHDDFTKSISRKPNSLMLERAIYKWNINVKKSFMVGDSLRDIEAASKVGIKGLFINNIKSIKKAEKFFQNSAQALNYINKL